MNSWRSLAKATHRTPSRQVTSDGRRSLRPANRLKGRSPSETSMTRPASVVKELAGSTHIPSSFAFPLRHANVRSVA